MNTTKVDVFHFVNEEVKTLVGGESMSLASFHQLWRTEYPCSNTPVLEILKVLPILGIQVRDGSNYECRYEIADKGALPCAYPTSDGGKTRLLVVQEVSHDNPRLLHVFDYGWYGPEHDHGPEDEADCEEH
jgi:hypothetical protein